MSQTIAPLRDPAAADALIRNLLAAAAAGDTAREHALAAQGEAEGLAHPRLFAVLARRAEREGRLERALDLLRRALELAPSDLELIVATGYLILKLERWVEAAAVFDTATRLDLRSVPAWFGRATALLRAGDVDGAAEDFAYVLRLAPAHADALGALARLSAQRAEREQARILAERALALDPAQPSAAMALVSLAFFEGDPEGAERRLRALLAEGRLDPADRALARLSLGDALDRQGRHQEAFGAWSSGKSEIGRHYAERFAGAGEEAPVAVARRLAAAVEALPSAPPPVSTPAARDQAAGHVFVIGFPMSGDAEIAGWLSRRSDTAVLANRPLLLDAEAAFVAPPDGLERLAAASDAELDSYRARYWRTARAHHVDPTGRVFVDRQPLNLLRLPVLARLFPDARVLLAVRDPRDVVLDGFRTGFAVNAATYQFVSLEGTARYYDALMAALAVFRERLPVELLEVRYEALAAAPAAEAARIAGFLGLPAEAPAPEASADAVGAWRAHATRLAPVSRLLAPWIARFGYAAD
jgi:tetratricopeptide (TPR) repeat protein